tara:strand:+ start:278 stop:619 length:342 start_codon:yes stop_codon:yes gene_type:complete
MIELTIILTLSVALNIFFIFYLKWLLKNFTFLSENVYNLLETVDTFSNHLSAIYELETFYGDETLQNLLTHAKQVVDEIGTYKDIFTITSDEEQIGDLFNEIQAGEEAGEEEE